MVDIKVGGAWKSGDAYVKVNGVWKAAQAIYSKIDGVWKTLESELVNIFDPTVQDYATYIRYANQILGSPCTKVSDESTAANRCAAVAISPGGTYEVHGNFESRFRLATLKSSNCKANYVVTNYVFDPLDHNNTDQIGDNRVLTITAGEDHDLLLIGYYTSTGSTPFLTIRNTIQVYQTAGEPVQPPVVTTQFSGTGAELDPYLITSAENLQTLANNVNAGNTYEGKYFLVTQDIDLSGIPNWTPIGSGSANQFGGYFNGGNKTISNLTINRNTDECALFGWTLSGSSIENVIMTDVNVTGVNFVGGLIGYAGGSVDNCSVSGIVNGGNDVGGLIGCSDNTVTNCSSSVNVTGSGNYTGGLIGTAYGGVSNCYASGNVSNSGDCIGGLIGWAANNVLNCYASGSVNSPGNYTGGLTGYVSVTVTNCVALNITVSGASNVGRLYGTKVSNAVVSNCYALSTMQANGAANGSDVTPETALTQNFYTNVLGWAFPPWVWIDGEYPKLMENNKPLVWTQANMPSSRSWASVCYGNGKFVTIANGSSACAYSTDGINWTQGALPRSQNWSSMCYGHGKFVTIASGSSACAYSTDGINWTEGTLPSSQYWASICYGNGKFVAVAYSSKAYAYSTDGINWTQGTLPSSRNWESVCYGNGKFVAIAYYSNAYAYSTDGINWTQANISASQYLNSMCYGNGKFVVVVDSSNVYAYSNDGINWTEGTLPSSEWWTSICYGDGKFVAVTGNSNACAYSNDGINWTEGTLPSSQYWASICYGNGKFVAVTYYSNASAYANA